LIVCIFLLVLQPFAPPTVCELHKNELIKD
jgi:hypothetical protein